MRTYICSTHFIEEVSKPNPSTHSRILEAAKNGDFETLKLLVSRDNVNCRDTEGRNSTPLHFAAGYNRIKVVEFLVSMGAKVSAKDKGYVCVTVSTVLIVCVCVCVYVHMCVCLCKHVCVCTYIRTYVCPSELENATGHRTFFDRFQ